MKKLFSLAIVFAMLLSTISSVMAAGEDNAVSGSGSRYMYYMEPDTGFRTASFPNSGGIIFTTGTEQYVNDAYILCRD